MKVYLKMLNFLLMFLFVTTGYSKTLEVTKLRSASTATKTRLVFELTAKFSYTTALTPEKITLDIKHAKLGVDLNKKKFHKTAIGSLFSLQHQNNLRLVLNLTKPVKLKHFVLSKPDRLVLDLYSEDKEVFVEIKQTESAASKSRNLDAIEESLINKINQVSAKENLVSDKSGLAEQSPKLDSIDNSFSEEKNYQGNSERDVVVVIDPGHGGIDSGAVGQYGTREKDVTLAVAKTLQGVINQTPGFRAILTRSKDYFIPLRSRLNIAHNHKADMFISIHADAYKNRDAHGASIFALSQRGATSEAARWLAEKENESELGQAISDKNALLRSVLIDLAQTATISASLDIGGKILQGLANIASLHSRNVEQAAFVVLKSPDIPSLLVEVGFISYAKEEVKLRNPDYQKAIAVKLASGIQNYFSSRPPLGTSLAKIKNGGVTGAVTLRDSLPSGDY